MHRPRRPFLSLLALALFVRALVPTGWMPTLDPDGLALAPCPVTGPVLAASASTPPPAAAHSAHGHHHEAPSPAPADHAEHDAASETCPFGALAAAGAILPPATLWAAPTPEAAPARLALVPLPVRDTARLRPPARAPPRLA